MPPAYWTAIAVRSYCSDAESSKRELAHAMRSSGGTSIVWCLILMSKVTEMVLEAAAPMTQGRATISSSRGQQRRTRDRPKQMQ
jgi:hypothetical protein